MTIYYFFGNYEEVIEDGVLKTKSYYFANGQRIAQRVTSGEDTDVYYIHTDHLGSAVRLTDEDGEIVQSTAYDPYGATVYSSGVDQTSYQFTGQELDEETGLYYYGARYYDPGLGRFIQPDTILDGLNRFTYCYNNPIKYTDPTGHNPHRPNLHFGITRHRITSFRLLNTCSMWRLIHECARGGAGTPPPVSFHVENTRTQPPSGMVQFAFSGTQLEKR